MIESHEKRKKVKNFLDTMDIDFKDFKDEIWTSGNDLGVEGSYIWMTTGQRLGSAELSFSIFDNKKHLNPLGLFLQKINSENCLAVFNKFKHGLTLNDDNCFKERFFLCEKLNHHHEHNDCDDEDDHFNENRNEVFNSADESSKNYESWDINADESQENDEDSWDINEDDKSPENEDNWNINDNFPETENNEDNNEDSDFHNTSENESAPEVDSWDNIS